MINLDPGEHEIVIIYFEAGGANVLEVGIESDAGGDYPTEVRLQDADVQANTGDDIVNRGEGDDTILGGAGDDTLDGGADNDALDGGTGDDSLTGGGAVMTSLRSVVVPIRSLTLVWVIPVQLTMVTRPTTILLT